MKMILLFVLIGILVSCTEDEVKTTYYPSSEEIKFVPGDVFVGIKSGTAIQTVFEFINQFDLPAERIHSLTFTSELPSDSLQYVLDVLNEKTYTNDGVTWFVTGYLHYQTQQITIFPKLYDMENTAHQADWLNSMTELELRDKHHPDLTSGIIHFKVPEGEEMAWEKQFEAFQIVDWAELNYIVQIELH